jgi:ABC-type glycerol-3-phosphate transport system substrate-binding protein
MKKTVLCSLVLIFTSALVFGGGSKSPGSAGGDTTIRIMTRWSDDAPLSKYWRGKIQEWNNQKNGITIIDESLSDEAAFLDKLRSSIASGTQPEIFIEYGGSRIQDYVEAGILLDVQPYLDADAAWRGSFLNDLFDKWHFTTRPGTYGVPCQFYSVFLYYNKKILAEAGFSNPPATLDEWRAVCDALLAKGRQPMSLGAKDNWRAGHFLNNLVMKSFGAKGASDIARRAMNYDDPRMINLYRIIKEFNDKGYWGPNAIGVGNDTEDSDFLANKTALRFQGSWFIPQLVADYQGDISNIGIAPFPYLNAAYRDSWQGGTAEAYSISNRKATNDAAIQVVKYLTSPEYYAGAEAYCKGGMYVSRFNTQPGVTIDPITRAAKALLANAKEFRDDIQTYDPESHMLDTVRSALQGLFIGSTPEQVGREIVNKEQVR